MDLATTSIRRVQLGDVEIELFDTGESATATAGPPLLFLHGAAGFDARHPYVGPLAAGRRLIAPAHPGFGRSSLPDWLDTVDDIAHLYVHLLDQLGLEQVDIIGCSLGGWIAAELASRVPRRVRRLVLVGPVGVKTGPTDRLDVPDIFAISPPAVQQLLWHDPAKGRIDVAALPDEALAIIARNRETLTLLTWNPYMHSPKLARRLHVVDAKVLLLRGASDGLVSAEYLARYAALFADAATAEIAAAGHAPQIEQPDAFAATVRDFLNL